MRYTVKPCGTLGVKTQHFLVWVNAWDYAYDLIERGIYSRVMLGVEKDYNGTPTYEPLGYLTREDGIPRWVAFAGNPNTPTAGEIVANQVRGYRHLAPCT